MNYSNFISILKKNEDLDLVFEVDTGTIRQDYHITEVLQNKVKAIDCGGAVDVWEETILQIVEPKTQESGRIMKTRKALDILEKSNSIIKLNEEAILILEYRPMDSMATSRFKITEVLLYTDKIIVKTEGSKTQCKAAERKNGNSDSCRGKRGEVSVEQIKSSCCN